MQRYPLALSALLVVSLAPTPGCGPPTLYPGDLTHACRAGDDTACLTLAATARAANPPAHLRARAFLTTACDRGHALACGQLGLMTLHGLGAPPSRAAAAPLLERACTGAPGTRSCRALADLEATWADDVAVGRTFACALTHGATLWCWGDLGVTAPPPRDPTARPVWPVAPAEPSDSAAPAPHRVLLGGEDRPATALAVGTEHACAIDHLGEVWCWGRGSRYGTLGLAAPESACPLPVLVDPELRFAGARYGWIGRPLGHARALALGACYSCALLTDASVRCWGCSEGYWDDAARVRPAGELPDDIAALYGGATEACALTRAGVVWCGLPDHAHALEGTPPLVVAVGPASTPLALTADGHLWRWTAPGEPPHAIATAPAAVDLRAWNDRFCLRTADAHVLCADLDGRDLAPLADLAPAASLVAPRGRDLGPLCVATPDGRVRCLGPNDRGQLGDPSLAAHPTGYAFTLPDVP